jgi:hypothetical protein
MYCVAARQGLARLHQPRVRHRYRVATAYNPRVIHQDEIEDRSQKNRIMRRAAQIRFGSACGPHKNRQQIIVADQPAEGLQGNCFGGIPRQAHKLVPFVSKSQRFVNQLVRKLNNNKTQFMGRVENAG